MSVRVFDGEVYIAVDEYIDKSSTETYQFVTECDTFRMATQRTPASASAAGYVGEFCFDSNYLYYCVATDTWKRTLLTTWI